jgi:hypothetical protein
VSPSGRVARAAVVKAVRGGFGDRRCVLAMGGFFELGRGVVELLYCGTASRPPLSKRSLSEMSRETYGRVWSVETVHHARAGWVKSARTHCSETAMFDAKH